MFGSSSNARDDFDSVDHPGYNDKLLSSPLHKEELIDSVEVGENVEDRSDRQSRLSFASSFSALHPTNSAYLTAFLLLNTMIGSGILNQPYVFRESGLLMIFQLNLIVEYVWK